MANLPLFYTIEGVKKFFAQQGFLETPTPPIVTNPGMEAHLHPFKVESAYKNHITKHGELYLHTSPEFFMKSLLSDGLEKIYSLSYCFRDEPASETHRFQFLMLEWYRAHEHYSQIKEDALNLIESVRLHLQGRGVNVIDKLEPVKKTVDELFCEYVGFSILDYLETKALKEILEQKHPSLLPRYDDLWPWEDYFHLAFLNLIEPHFMNIPLIVVDEFPAPLAALSTLKKDDPRVCERFEVYLKGVELCNCFNELTDLQEQKNRLIKEAATKKEIYNYELPEPTILYQALDKGIPSSAGIALGVERLLLGLSQKKETPIFFE